MIRINLLGVERQKARKAPTFDIGQRLTVACSLILVAAVVGIGWWYWALSKNSARVDAEIAAAQQEAARLQAVIAEVLKFEAQRARLQQRVQLIEQLRSGQSIPVQLLDHVSRSLPDMLWLTDMAQDGGAVPLLPQHGVEIAQRVGVDRGLRRVLPAHREPAPLRLQHRHGGAVAHDRHGGAAGGPVRAGHVAQALQPPFVAGEAMRLPWAQRDQRVGREAHPRDAGDRDAHAGMRDGRAPGRAPACSRQCRSRAAPAPSVPARPQPRCRPHPQPGQGPGSPWRPARPAAAW